jgi:hypothetical protein
VLEEGEAHGLFPLVHLGSTSSQLIISGIPLRSNGRQP